VLPAVDPTGGDEDDVTLSAPFLEGLDGGLSARARAAMSVMEAPCNLIVALSGGVDSGVLLALAVAARGPSRVVAATGDSPSLARDDLAAARGVARHLGVRHVVVETRELDRPAYRANAGDRCFHCRTELFEVLAALARRAEGGEVAYGAIADDSPADRPGMAAAEQHGILAPLRVAGLDKRDVRRLAAAAGLPVQDKPASPCLASRLPVGTLVTPDRLARVERAEAVLRALGFGRLRVRDHHPVARVEVGAEEMARLVEPAVRSAVVEGLKQAGFPMVTVDLEGYRSAE
jgi:uncharacterized protein